MSFHLHPEAVRELDEAVEYYEDIEPGLGGWNQWGMGPLK